jgi:dockerin type I repeat protein
MPLDVSAAFDDGSDLGITRSSLVTYRAVDKTVASVDMNGVITAVGAGATAINISYGNQATRVQISVPKSIRGDLNGDGQVDRDDLNIILVALNTTATGSFDARDLNKDGVINKLDVNILRTLCTLPNCATHRTTDEHEDEVEVEIEKNFGLRPQPPPLARGKGIRNVRVGGAKLSLEKRACLPYSRAYPLRLPPEADP